MKGTVSATCDAIAADIYQGHLDLVSDLLLSGDFEECVRYFDLPLLIRTRSGETLIETHEDILTDTRLHSESLNGHRVNNYIRLVKQARHLSDSLIEGWHETYILRDATSILPSYRSHMYICDKGDGIWKVVEAEHELEGLRFPLSSVRSRPGSFAETWQDTQNDIRVTYSHAEPIYSAFLEALDKNQNEANFARWADQFAYPLEAHYVAVDRTFRAPEEKRPFFDTLQKTSDGVDCKVKRTISTANFISSDRICGYHEAIISGNDSPSFGPVKSRMILTLSEDQWKCSSVTNSLLGDDATPETDFIPSRHLPTMSEIQKRMKKK